MTATFVLLLLAYMLFGYGFADENDKWWLFALQLFLWPLFLGALVRTRNEC